jgi:hypothetical protein
VGKKAIFTQRNDLRSIPVLIGIISWGEPPVSLKTQSTQRKAGVES